MRTEFDASDIAWETYRLMYSENLPIEFQFFGKKRKYILEKFRYHTNISEEIKFSGDTDFNFTPGFAHSRLECYEKLLESSNNPKMYSDKLNLLKQLTYSIVNISIMPKTGNLQSAKQGIGNDRLDTFIWTLDEYYNENSNLLMNHSSFENIKLLQSYLNMFGNVYNYCETIYHINKSLVQEMITLGKQTIDSPEKVICLMDLAIKFFRQKLCFLSNQVEINNLSSVFAEHLERVQKIILSYGSTYI